MPDDRIQCDQFEQMLAEADGVPESSVPLDHVESCAECLAQLQAHRVLAATLAGEEVPDLSPAFQAGLERKLASRIEVRPLRGWRKAAMLTYWAAALGLLGWILKDVPLPVIDPSEPWVTVAAFVAVPLTFVLAIAASLWIPGPGLPRGMRMLA